MPEDLNQEVGPLSRGVRFHQFMRDEVAAYLRMHASASRSELVEYTGLSRGAMDRLLAEMLREGSLHEDTIAVAGGNTPGRPARRLHLRPVPRTTLAVIVGAFELTCALVDADGNFQSSTTATLPLSVGRSRTLTEARRIGEKALSQVGCKAPDRVVLGLPTLIDFDTQTISPAGARGKMPTWQDDATVALARAVFSNDVIVCNTAALSTLAECWARPRTSGNTVYVSVSSQGIGSGLYAGSALNTGAHGFAGELSHVSITTDGVICPCGQRGCLAAEVRNQVRQFIAAYSQWTDGNELDLRKVENGDDPGAIRLIEDIGWQIGRALGGIVNMLDPHLVLIHDGLTPPHLPSVAGSVEQSLARHVHPSHFERLRIEKASLGSSAALVGAGLIDLSVDTKAGDN